MTAGSFMARIRALVSVAALGCLSSALPAGAADRLVFDHPAFYGTAELSGELDLHPQLERRMKDSAEKLILELRTLAIRESASAGAAGYAFQPYEVIITDRVTLATPEFVSILRQGYAFTGGGQGNEWSEPVLWEVAQLKVVGIERLLGDGSRRRDGLRALSEILRAGIAEQVWDNQIDPTWVEDIEAVTAPDPAILSNFVLLPSTVPGKIGGLAFQYDRYSVAPYVLGSAEIVVPQAQIRDYLRPRLQALFGGAPQPRS